MNKRVRLLWTLNMYSLLNSIWLFKILRNKTYKPHTFRQFSWLLIHKWNRLIFIDIEWRVTSDIIFKFLVRSSTIFNSVSECNKDWKYISIKTVSSIFSIDRKVDYAATSTFDALIPSSEIQECFSKKNWWYLPGNNLVHSFKLLQFFYINFMIFFVCIARYNCLKIQTCITPARKK